MTVLRTRQEAVSRPIGLKPVDFSQSNWSKYWGALRRAKGYRDLPRLLAVLEHAMEQGSTDKQGIA
jgi:hypothetical protein